MRRRYVVAFWAAAGLAAAACYLLGLAACMGVERYAAAAALGASPGVHHWWGPARTSAARGLEAAAWIGGAVIGALIHGGGQ